MSLSETPKPPVANSWGEAIIDLSGLTLIWLLALAIVNPFDNFPLHDDWSYGLAVKHLVETGNYEPNGWESMTLITNVLWGSIFCLPKGFSFIALRCSTLAASWLGILGVYWLMKEIRQPRSVALLAASVLAFNPLHFRLSISFMTDVPYLTLTVFAAIFFLKNLRDDSHASLILGTLFSIAAILSRQIGLAVPLAFAIAAIFQRGFKVRAVLRAAIPLAAGIIVLVAFQHWLSATGRLSDTSKASNERLAETFKNPGRLAAILFRNLYVSLTYLGLFLSPVLFFKFSDFGLWCKKKVAVLLLIAVALVVAINIEGRSQNIFAMPLAGDMLIKSGIGPLTLFDTFFLDGTVTGLPNLFWLVVTVISLAGAAILIYRLVAGLAGLLPRLVARNLELHESSSVFLLLVPAIYLTLFAGDFFDRYLIPMIPLAVAGLIICRPPVAAPRPSAGNLAMVLMLAGFFIYSVGGVHDYLEWNRVRWAALDDLMEKSKISPAELDGGFEFNGYYSPLFNYSEARTGGADHPKGGHDTHFWDLNAPYALAFNRVNGYDVLNEYHYAHWLPPYTGTIYFLKNNQPAYFLKNSQPADTSGK